MNSRIVLRAVERQSATAGGKPRGQPDRRQLDRPGPADGSTLLALLAEWNSSRDRATRIANLTDGSGSPERENGDHFLRPGETVFDDGDPDVLNPGPGNNWLFFNRDEDELRGLRHGVFAGKLDWLDLA